MLHMMESYIENSPSFLSKVPANHKLGKKLVSTQGTHQRFLGHRALYNITVGKLNLTAMATPRIA